MYSTNDFNNKIQSISIIFDITLKYFQTDFKKKLLYFLIALIVSQSCHSFLVLEFILGNSPNH